MCGLVGFIGSGKSIPALNGDRALKALAHRGPDAAGAKSLEVGGAPLWLGHTRLRILDVSPGADQPMASDDGLTWVAYNGEIYDHADHRARLSRLRPFRTRTDTEVLLRLYEEAGGVPAAFLARMRGMFAFALADLARGRFVLARDRLGIKPVVFAERPGMLAFASEIRALRALGMAGGELDREAAADYLRWGVVPDPRTIASGVRVLPPGSYLLWEGGASVVRRYWSPALGHGGDGGWLAEVLDDAVSRHLVADRPVGVFLSGGLDSQAVAHLAARHGELRTLTVTFPEEGGDEGEAAARVARRAGAKHSAVPVTGAEVAGMLPDLLEAMDSPTHDGVNTWVVCRAAREAGLVVAISGLGGDELFGGYPSFRALPILARLGPLWALPAGLRLAAARALARRRPGTPAARLLAARGEAASLYAAVRTLLSPADLGGLPHTPDAEAPGEADIRDVTTLLELTRYLPDQLLRDTDQMSMRHSLEVRVPLLDDRVVEAALALPAAERFRPGKAALAAAAGVRDHLPKRPFALPFGHWIRGPLRAAVEEGLRSDLLPLPDLLPRAARLRLWDAFEGRRTHWSRPWAVAVLRLWAAHHELA